MQFYENRIRVRVCGLCCHENRLLLVKHLGLFPTGEGFWSPVGGGLEFGERLEEALVREFKEETNLDVTIGTFLFTHQFISDTLHAIEFFYEVHLGDTANVCIGSEPEPSTIVIDSVEWLSFDEIRAIPAKEVHQIFSIFDNYHDLLNYRGIL